MDDKRRVCHAKDLGSLAAQRVSEHRLVVVHYFLLPRGVQTNLWFVNKDERTLRGIYVLEKEAPAVDNLFLTGAEGADGHLSTMLLEYNFFVPIPVVYPVIAKVVEHRLKSMGKARHAFLHAKLV